MAAAAIAAAAVPLPGANQGGAQQRRLGVDRASTRLTVHGQPTAALDPDEVALPHDSPAVKSLRYLRWRIAGDQAIVAQSEIQGVCLLSCHWDAADQASHQSLTRANLVEHQLTWDVCSDILRELHEARIFEQEYASEGELWATMDESLDLNPNRLKFSPAWLEVRDPFDTQAVDAVPARPAGVGRRGAPAVAAVPAVPAQPGPTELKCLHLTSWLSIIAEGERQVSGQGFRLLSRTVSLLSHRSRNEIRRDANSDLRTVAATLSTYVSQWASMGRNATSSQIARQLPSYLVHVMSIMPMDQMGPCGSAVACEAEMRDGHTLLCGRETEVAAVMWARIHHHLDRFPVLDQFQGRLSSSGATREVLERLMIGINVPAGSPLVRTLESCQEIWKGGAKVNQFVICSQQALRWPRLSTRS